MAETSYILGVKIIRDSLRKIIALSQISYIEKILEWFKMKYCNLCEILIAKGEILSQRMYPITPQDKEVMDKKLYAQAIESLIYTMVYTKPNICSTISLVSCFQSNPVIQNWKLVKRILRYMKSIIEYCLYYQGLNLKLEGYSNAN